MYVIMMMMMIKYVKIDSFSLDYIRYLIQKRRNEMIDAFGCVCCVYCVCCVVVFLNLK